MNEYETETVTRAGIEYKIFKSPVTGLMIVHADDVKIGQTQTLAGARIIRRNHSRRVEQDNRYPSNSLDEGSDFGPEDY